jgi:hypothetical protein
MPKESKYAKELRALGCTPYSELLLPSELRESNEEVESVFGDASPTKMTRQDRRRLVAQKLLPNFASYEDGLFIMDETGVDWSGPVSAHQPLVEKLKFKHLGSRQDAMAFLRSKMN